MNEDPKPDNRKAAPQRPQDEAMPERERWHDLTSAVLDALDALVIVLDGEGRIRRFNRACEVLTGYREAEIRGRQVWDLLIAPEEVETVKAVFQDLRAAGVPGRHENDWVTRAGDRRRIEWRNTVLFDDEGQTVEYIVGTGMDVTERRRSEQQLRLLTTALDAAANGIIITDREGAIQWVNPAFTALTGYTAEEVLGENPRLFKSGRQSAAFYRQMWQTILAGRVWHGEVINRRRDGSLYTEEMTITPMRDREARITHFIAIKQDVTRRREAEEALQDSEEKYRLLVENASEGIVVAQDEEIRFANRKIAAIVGQPAEALIGRPFIEFVHPEDRELVARRYQERLRGEEVPGVYPFRVVSTDGRTLWMELNAVVITWQKRPATLNFLTDITQHREAEEALRESEAQFRSLAENSPNMIFINRGGRVVYANRKCEELMGYTRQQFYAPDFDFMCLIAPESREAVRVNYEAHLRGEERPPFDYSLITREGEKIAGILTTRLIEYQGETAILGIITDISERKRAEEELAAERERLSTTLRSIRDGVLAIDGGGQILFANPGGQSCLERLADARVGGRLTALGGVPLDELLGVPHDPPSLHEVVSKGPDERIFEVTPQPLEAGLTGWVLVLRDVTEERETRERVQSQDRLAAVGHLAAGIAHDFNNILQGILGFCELLQRRGDLPDKAQRQIELIQQQGRRGAHLIHQVLDFSRQSLSRQHPVNLVLVLREAVKLLRQALPESIEIQLEINEGSYPVNVDVAQFQQALVNLAVNARDAMPAGGRLTLSLSASRWTPGESAPLAGMEERTWAVLRIADTGTGISADIRPHIFEPFFSTKPLPEGTGLGLAQVFGIITQHEGFIDVESEAGAGTTFIIYLPLLPGDPLQAKEASLQEAPCGSGELILLVEDDDIVLTVTRRMLEMIGYRVRTARDGRQALAIYERHQREIDLILTDMVMPHLGGQALVEALWNRGHRTRVLIMSGYPREQEVAGTWKPNVVGWLEKPIDGHTLAWAIREALDGEAVALEGAEAEGQGDEDKGRRPPAGETRQEAEGSGE